MRPLLDANNDELTAVLELLIGDDATISVREISRRHSTLKNASAFTRNPARMALIEAAQQRQRDARSVKVAPAPSRGAVAAQALAVKDTEVHLLRRQVELLVASHAACIKAVMTRGGLGSLERFWSEYKDVGDMVRALNATPSSAQVVRLAVSDRT